MFYYRYINSWLNKFLLNWLLLKFGFWPYKAFLYAPYGLKPMLGPYKPAATATASSKNPISVSIAAAFWCSLAKMAAQARCSGGASDLSFIR